MEPDIIVIAFVRLVHRREHLGVGLLPIHMQRLLRFFELLVIVPEPLLEAFCSAFPHDRIQLPVELIRVQFLAIVFFGQSFGIIRIDDTKPRRIKAQLLVGACRLIHLHPVYPSGSLFTLPKTAILDKPDHILFFFLLGLVRVQLTVVLVRR